MTKQNILHRLAYFRNKRNVSAYKLGRDLGHANNYFYRIENGDIELTVALLLDAPDYLNVTTSEFFLTDLNSCENKLQ